MNKSPMGAAQRALVTGATSGIGAALARRFAQAGHELVLIGRSADRLELLRQDLVRQHRAKPIAITADLAEDGAAAKLAATLKRRRLPIDILVNNAGVNHQGSFKDMAPAKHQEIIRLNIAAATDLLAHFIPPMVARGHGRVLNIVGTAAFLPVPFMATYAASKAYLLSLTESLSEELYGSGVTLSALCPGVTATPMMDRIKAANPRYVRLVAATVSNVDEVAAAGYDACMRGDVIRVPGSVNLLTTIAGRTMPKWVIRRVVGLVGRMGM
jgi:hypothetical protein